MTLPLCPAVYAVLPSLAIASPDTLPVGFSSVSVRVPRLTSHTMSRPSAAADTSAREFGKKPRAVTGASCRPTATRSLPVRRSTMRTEPSRAPNAKVRPSGLSAAGAPPPRQCRIGRSVVASRMFVQSSAELEVTNRVFPAMKPTSAPRFAEINRAWPSRSPVTAFQRWM